jgi:hypothetical protein
MQNRDDVRTDEPATRVRPWRSRASRQDKGHARPIARSDPRCRFGNPAAARNVVPARGVAGKTQRRKEPTRNGSGCLFAAAFPCQPALVPSSLPRSFGGTNEGPLSRRLLRRNRRPLQEQDPVSRSALLAYWELERAQSRSYSRIPEAPPSRYPTTGRCLARVSEACVSASSDISTPGMLRAIPNRSRGWIIAVKLLAEAGAEIREITLPALQDFSACGQIILAAEAYAVHEQWLKERPEDYGARARERLLAGPTLRAVDYLQAVRWRLQLRDRGSEGLCGHRPGDNRLEHGSRLPH